MCYIKWVTVHIIIVFDRYYNLSKFNKNLNKNKGKILFRYFVSSGNYGLVNENNLITLVMLYFKVIIYNEVKYYSFNNILNIMTDFKHR